MINKNGKPSKKTAAQISKMEDELNLAFSTIPDMISEAEITKEIASQLDLTHYSLVKECLYRLHYGDRYLIVKGKTFAGSLYLMYKGYVYFVAGGQGTGHRDTLGPGLQGKAAKEHHYSKFYTYVKQHPGLIFRIELIMESEDGYQLLTREQQELDAAKADPNFMNNNATAYIPATAYIDKPDKDKKEKWIKKGVIGAFHRYSPTLKK